MRVLIAPDKFKGSLTARTAAEAIAKGMHVVFPDALFDLKPITDGGEGFADALAKRKSSAQVHDPLGRLIVAEYGWADDATAVIEMSAASGLQRLAPQERDPLRATSSGTGELIANALAQGAKKILVGLGGSATNDGGAGMAAALGYEFVTSDGEPIAPTPENLLSLYRIKPPERDDIASVEFIAACDVQNPLLGERGASRIYAPQKGAADARTIEALDLALEQLADIVGQDLGCDFRNVPGAGAAGGLAFGLMSFCNAKIRAGFELIAETLRLEEVVAASDLVITGEGKLDAQTFEGKAPAGIAALARKCGKPVVAFAGMIDLGDDDNAKKAANLFDATFQITPNEMSPETAMQNAAELLKNSARAAAEQIRAGKLLSRFPHLSS